MPTDIVTLAIECKTNSAVSSLDRFNSKLNESQNMSGKLAGTITGLFASNEIRKFGRESIQIYSDLAEETQKFDVVFQGLGARTTKLLKEMQNDYGQSELSARRMIALTGDMLTGFGFGREEALNMAEAVAKLGADIASFSNYAGGAEGAAMGITKAMLGETEQAKMLGIAIKTDTPEYKKLTKEIMETNNVTFTQAKAIAALRIAYEQSPNAIGDFKRNMESLANQERILSNNMVELKSNVGEVLSGPFLTGVQTVNKLVTGFNKLDKGTQEFIVTVGGGLAVWASMKAVLSGVELLKNANNAFTGRLAGETAAISAQTAAVNAQTAAYSALNKAKNAPSLGKMSSDLSGAWQYSKHTEWDRADIQGRWDARRQARQAQNYQTNVMPGLIGTSGGNVKEIAVGAGALGSNAKNAARALRAANTNFTNLNQRLAFSKKEISFLTAAFLPVTDAVGKVKTEFNSLSRYIEDSGGIIKAGGKGIVGAFKGVGGALTGGQKGLLGFANSVSGLAAAIPIAISSFKLGGYLRQKFDVWMGWEEGEEKALARGAEAEAKIKEIRAKRAAAAKKTAEEQEKNKAYEEARSKFNEKENKRLYNEMSLAKQLAQDQSKLNALSTEYRDEQMKQKPDYTKLAGMTDEIVNLRKSINEKEKRILDAQIAAKDMAYDQAMHVNDYARAQAELAAAQKLANEAFQKAEKDGLKARNPEEYNQILQRQLGYNQRQKELLKKQRDDAKQLTDFQFEKEFGATSSTKEQKKLIRERMNFYAKEMEMFAKQGEQDEFMNSADKYTSFASRLGEISKSTEKFFNGIVTSSQALTFGSMEAYREQRRIYETRPNDDRNDKTIQRNAANKVVALLPVLKNTLDTIAKNTEKGFGNSSITFQAR